MDRTLPTFLTSSTSGVFSPATPSDHRAAQPCASPLPSNASRAITNHTFTTIPSCISPQPECKVADTVASRATSDVAQTSRLFHAVVDTADEAPLEGQTPPGGARVPGGRADQRLQRVRAVERNQPVAELVGGRVQ